MTAAATLPTARRHVAGDGLLNPVALVAVAVLIANDHVLKSAWPGFVTGKLSDFCGLIFFPLFLQGAVEVAQAALGLWRGPSERVLLVSLVLTGAAFTLIKTVPFANDLAANAMGFAQYLLGQLTLSSAAPHAVSIALDPRDLVALPMLGVAYVIGRKRLH